MQHPLRLVHIAAWLSCAVVVVPSARAQLDLGVLQAHSPLTNFSQFRIRRSDNIPVMVYVPDAESDAAAAEGLVRLSPTLYATRRKSARLSGLIAQYPGWRWFWTPPRSSLLDRVVKNVHADAAQQNFGRTGRGVVVGIVDTGIDPTHLDFRSSDGRTRIKYYLDLSQSAPLGKHADLEVKYGCTSKDSKTGEYTMPCAVYSGDDINALLTSRSSQLPQDAIGHGSHVASLAAGNGLSARPAKYVGIAPEADLVVVNATRDNMGDLQDADIILGAQFVFDIAHSMNEPAVVNLSLGSDAGAHDGTSKLEIELSKLVGPNLPGQAIVVAAGNSGDLYSLYPNYPQPVGVHSSVQVLPDGNETRVPVLVDSSVDTSAESQVIAWVQTREGDQLSMGVETDSGACIAPVDVGQQVDEKLCNGTKVSVFTGSVGDPSEGGSVARPALVMVAEGLFESPQALTLTFTGSGTAFVWVQGTGGLTGGQCVNGACVPAASRERTVAVPASATDLIAVGATINRTGWTDVDGTSLTLADLGDKDTYATGDVATFSAGGPNQLEDMKPDILSPGGFVVGAMATLADPRNPENAQYGMFDGSVFCDYATSGCALKNALIADDSHAVAMGTSMAAPIVAGTIALLFQANPNMTQQDARRFLQSGAQKIPGYIQTTAQEGPGLLDVNGALTAQSGQAVTASTVDIYTSWISLATALAHPDETWPVRGAIHLRDANRDAVTLDPSNVSVSITNGHLASPLQLVGYGYYTFELVADQDSGRQLMTVNVDAGGQHLFPTQLYIGVDVPSARGEVVAGRGCSFGNRPAPNGALSLCWCVALGALVVARRARTLLPLRPAVNASLVDAGYHWHHQRFRKRAHRSSQNVVAGPRHASRRTLA